jgi:hypothetical protein
MNNTIRTIAAIDLQTVTGGTRPAPPRKPKTECGKKKGIDTRSVANTPSGGVLFPSVTCKSGAKPGSRDLDALDRLKQY